MKIIKDKKADSAVIGVILMVAITVAIAATTYVYVKIQLDENETIPEPEPMLEINMTLNNYWIGENNTLGAIISIDMDDPINETNNLDIFVVVYETNVEDRKSVNWTESHFVLEEINGLESGLSTHTFENLTTIGDGYYKIEFEVWNRIDMAGASKLYEKIPVYIYPKIIT